MKHPKLSATSKRAISEYIAENGRRGGKAGTGAAKRRSDEHYRRLAALASAGRSLASLRRLLAE